MDNCFRRLESCHEPDVSNTLHLLCAGGNLLTFCLSTCTHRSHSSSCALDALSRHFMVMNLVDCAWRLALSSRARRRKSNGNPRISIEDSTCTSVILHSAYTVCVRPPASAGRCLETFCSMKKCNDDFGTFEK